MARRRASLPPVNGAAAKSAPPDPRERDTVPPPTRSHARLRGSPNAFTHVTVTSLRTSADRFRAGDFHAALLSAMRVMDDAPVPLLCASPTYLARVKLRSSERLLLTLVDGKTSLEDIFEAGGLGLLEGVDAICGLLDAGIIAFHPDDVEEPGTLPGV